MFAWKDDLPLPRRFRYARPAQALASSRERARHYTIARGSAYECLAVVDLLALEQSPHDFSEARVLIDRLCAILTRLMRR